MFGPDVTGHTHQWEPSKRALPHQFRAASYRYLKRLTLDASIVKGIHDLHWASLSRLLFTPPVVKSCRQYCLDVCICSEIALLMPTLHKKIWLTCSRVLLSSLAYILRTTWYPTPTKCDIFVTLQRIPCPLSVTLLKQASCTRSDVQVYSDCIHRAWPNRPNQEKGGVAVRWSVNQQTSRV